MGWNQFVTSIFDRSFQALERALTGLTENELDKQPNPDCNTIGWLAWHLTRGQDRSFAGLMQEEQIWMKDSWYQKFNRPPNGTDTGFGHSLEDVAAFQSPGADIILAYHQTVLERTKRYLADLTEEELERKLSGQVFPTVTARIAAVISDNLQHVGQIAYLRGLLKGKGWSNI